MDKNVHAHVGRAGITTIAVKMTIQGRSQKFLEGSVLGFFLEKP